MECRPRFVERAADLHECEGLEPQANALGQLRNFKLEVASESYSCTQVCSC